MQLEGNREDLVQPVNSKRGPEKKNGESVLGHRLANPKPETGPMCFVKKHVIIQ